MPAPTTEFRRKETVIAAQDLPGVPEGSAGIVLTSVGLTWERYRVRFDNGVEIGSIDVNKLTHADGSTGTSTPAGDRPIDPKAVTAFVAAVVGLVIAIGTWAWPFHVRPLSVLVLALLSLVAVVLAHRSLNSVSTGRTRGMALVVSSLVLGYLGLLFALLGAAWLLTD